MREPEPEPIPVEDAVPREPERRRPFVAWTLAGVNLLLFLLTLALSGGRVLALLEKDNAAIASGEWWRLLTPLLAHADLAHVVANALPLLLIGPLAEARLGSGRFLLVYLVAGVAGSVASFLLTPEPMVGASGAIFGIAGATTTLLLRGRTPADRRTVFVVLLFTGPDLALSFIVPHIDVWAHLGGLAAGAALGLVLRPGPG